MLAGSYSKFLEIPIWDDIIFNALILFEIDGYVVILVDNTVKYIEKSCLQEILID